MKQILSHIPVFFFSLILTIAVLGMYGFMYHEINASFGRAAIARSVVSAQKQNTIQLQNLIDLSQKTKADRDSLNNLFIGEDDEIAFIENLENLGQTVGAEMKLNNVVDKDAVGIFGSISANVDVNGSWQSVLRTLKLSETLPYQSSIDGVRLQSSLADPKSQKRVWRLTYNISATMLDTSTSTKIK